FDFEADRLTHLLGHVAREIGPGRARAVRTLVTADHGAVPVVPERQLRADRVPAIAAEMARPIAGDRRSGFFRARPGRREALAAALTRRLPAGARILGVDQALAAGLFGPPPYHPELRERIGDLIVLPPVPSGLLGATPRPESRSPDFLGSHSGLEPAELLVPLVSGSLYDLGGVDAAGGQP
ncbi:type I phosphodiesterase/nucleotide pyrophosphatase, partial [mine drainage metagenome]